jgi:aminoglycoside 3-N-acetyltransferase
MRDPSKISRREVADRLAAAGIAGGPVVVHSSLSSFGWVTGGAASVVGAYLDLGCTMIVPTFTRSLEVEPPQRWAYGRNGRRGLELSASPATKRYHPSATGLDHDMGAIPAAVLADRRRLRGGHPLNSFAAIGPLAPFLVSSLDSVDIYRPLKEVVLRDGFVVLHGVDYRSMTLLHLAEASSGSSLFRRWALSGSGRVEVYEVGSCSAGFEAFKLPLEPHVDRFQVGMSATRVLPAAAALFAAIEALTADPRLGACVDDTCERCRDRISGGPYPAEWTSPREY